MTDLDQVSEDLSEGEDIILQSPQPHLDLESNEDVEDESEVEVESEVEGDMPFVPPPLLPADAPSSSLVDPTLTEDYSPPELKLEPRSPPLVLSENTDIAIDIPDVPDQLPRSKRVYVRKPLPPPRAREGTRQAFDVALKTLSGTLKRKK